MEQTSVDFNVEKDLISLSHKSISKNENRKTSHVRKHQLTFFCESYNDRIKSWECFETELLYTTQQGKDGYELSSFQQLKQVT